MNLAIMQPYLFPYIGYFQLIHASDLFVLYDNIEYSKGGWVNRNRILRNGADFMLSFPLKKDSDYLDIVERELAPSINRTKLMNQVKSSYSKAPYYDAVSSLIEGIFYHPNSNLFDFLFNAIQSTCDYLGLDRELRLSSSIAADHQLKGEERVISICNAVGAKRYINATGGRELYSHNRFASSGLELRFIRSKDLRYPQFNDEFVPWLSIIDVMMFNSVEDIAEKLLPAYELEQ